MSQVVLKVHQLEQAPYERCERVRTRPGSKATVRWGCKRCATVVAASGLFRFIDSGCAQHRMLIPKAER
jgi:hypothetical protein